MGSDSGGNERKEYVMDVDSLPPLVSVVTPVGRWEPEFLREAADSLALLSLKGLASSEGVGIEWLLVLDSPAIPVAEVEALLQLYRFPARIVGYAQEVQRGPGESRNVGLVAASGAWLITLDADDRLLPDGIADLVCLVSSSPVLAYGVGRTCDIDEAGVWIGEGPPAAYPVGSIPRGSFYRSRVTFGTPPFHPCGAVMRTDTIRRIGGWPPWRRTEDTAMWSVLTSHYDGAWINEFVLEYRRNSAGVTKQSDYVGNGEHLLPQIAEFIRAGRVS